MACLAGAGRAGFSTQLHIDQFSENAQWPCTIPAYISGGLDMLELQVEGSSGDHYAVTFIREGNNLHTSCTCQAGQKGIHCKHRLSLLAGDISRVVGTPPSDIGSKIAALLTGSDVAQALENLHVAEATAATAQAELKRVKKALDRVMHS
jgi:hypothetical protein